MSNSRLARLLLLLAAYAPALVLIALRAWPTVWADAAAGAALLGVLFGLLFLYLLAERGAVTDFQLSAARPLDSDAAGYVASYLLPLVATDAKNDRDTVAYVLCFLLYGVVAFNARLWAVNPLIYLFGRRIWTTTVAGREVFVITKRHLNGTERIDGVERLGVVWDRG